MSTCLDCQGPIDRPHVRGMPPMLCLDCKRQRKRNSTNRWHRDNPDKVLRHKKRKPPATTLVCIDCSTEFPRSGLHGPIRTRCSDCRAAWRRQRQSRIVFRRRLAGFGITGEQYEAMLVAQGGCCAICGRDEPNGKGWHLDHDHSTGAVRGILCGNCNAGLGMFADDQQIMEMALRYLRAGGHEGRPIADTGTALAMS